MLDVAWPELIVIGAVALVAIGPKDLPRVMHALGRWTGKALAALRAAQSYFEQVSFEAERAEEAEKESKPPDNKPDSSNP
ncbi:MAG: hypothetical protein HGA90_08190 [Alphaproteobacteria bacterium]|nr:hypothetical protein [Alphaproteobacteria bacterium]